MIRFGIFWVFQEMHAGQANPWAGAEAPLRRLGDHQGGRMVRAPQWRPAMDKAGKSAALENLKGVFEGAGVVVVTHYTGLTVAEMTKLRGLLRKDGAHFKVVKNRLAKIALGGAGGDKAQELFQGPVAIAYSPDPVSAAKAADEFSK